MNACAPTRIALFALVLPLLAACPGSTPPTDTADMAKPPATADLAGLIDMADLATPSDLAEPPADLAQPPRDLAFPPDLTFHCNVAADCRLYSSYCQTHACQCLALPAKDPDPICNDGMVTCFMDPCAGKKAACDVVTGRCVVQ